MESRLIIATGHLCAGKTMRIEFLSKKLLQARGRGLATFDLVWVDRIVTGPETPRFVDPMFNALVKVAKKAALGKLPDYTELIRLCRLFGVPPAGSLPHTPDALKQHRMLLRVLKQLDRYDIGLGECRFMIPSVRRRLLDGIHGKTSFSPCLCVMTPEPAELLERCRKRYPEIRFSLKEIQQYYGGVYPLPVKSEGWDTLQFCASADAPDNGIEE